MIPKNLRSKSFRTQSHLRIPITSNFPRMKFNMAQSLEIVKGTFWLDSIWLLNWDMFSFFVHSSRCKVLWLQMVLLPKSMDALVSKGGWLWTRTSFADRMRPTYLWTIFAKCHLETSKHALSLYCGEGTPNEIAFNCRQIVWNLWHFLGAHIRTACGLSFWQVHRGESN